MTSGHLRTLALRTLLPTFAGPRPPAWALRLTEQGVGGFVLFGYNIVDPEQVAALTADLRAARPDVLVATDEEGGDVTRLYYATGSPYPGNAALGVIDDVALTAAVYQAIGAELAGLGINLDMAPAVDVNTADDNPAIGTRSFGANAAQVAAHAAAAVAGLQSVGVAACAKHFPGHGATEEDSHHDLPVVSAPIDVLRERELPPFRAALDAGARAVMTAHIVVPALTGELPATFSPRVLRDLLRAEMGFTGAVISDALEMQGASGAIGVPEAAVRALIAGNDLLCFGGEFPRAPGAEDLIEATAAAIVAAVTRGRLSEERLRDAAERAARLALPSPAALPSPGVVSASSGPARPVAVAGASHRPGGLGVAAARRALRVEGGLPSDLASAVIVQLEPAATIAVGSVPWGLAPSRPGFVTVRPGAGTVRLAEAGRPAANPPATYAGAAEEIAARAGARPIIVVSRDTHRHAWAAELVEALAKRHAGVVLVEMGWPAAWRPPGLRAYVATYGASRANAAAVEELLLGA